MYDHNVDQRGYKWSGKAKLKNIDIKNLPDFVVKNLNLYEKWMD